MIYKEHTENLFYTEAGEGVPIIFMHGSLSTGMETFSRQMEYFSENYRCICPDLRCHGKSTSLDHEWMTHNLADDIVCLMDRMSIEKAHLVGHSLGGDVAMYAVLNNIDRVLTATAISSSGHTNDNIFTYLRRFDPDKPGRERHAEFYDRIRQIHGEANQGDWKGFIKHSIWNCDNFPGFTDEDLEAMDVPFLFVRGTKDRLVKDNEIARLKAHIPQIETVMIEGGHYLTSDETIAPAFNRLLADFLAAH